MVSSYIARTLSQIPNCFNTDVSFGGRIRKRYLTTFIPPSTKTPIFKYGGNDDQRSFLSLVSSEHYAEDIEDGSSDDASIHSLPADMNDIESDPELQTLFRERSSLSLASISTHGFQSEEDNKGDEQEVYDDDDGDDMTSTNLNPVTYYPKKGKQTHSSHSSTTPAKLLKMSRQNSRSSIVTNKSGDIRRTNYGSISDALIGSRLDDDEEEEEDYAHEKVTMKSEIKVFIKNTIPLIITFCLSQSYTILTTITASKVFGKDQLSAVSLASMTAAITFSIFEGISTSLDVLCPQAYGSGNIKKVGLYTQRSIALSLIAFIPFGFLWWHSAYFFRLILESEELVQLTSSFLRILIFAAPFYIIFENAKRFLQCQGIFNASTLVLLISTPLSIITIQTLVHTIGFSGIAITCVLNFLVMCTLLISYIFVIDGMECWNGFTWDAFNGWGELVKFSFAGVVCTFLEASSWEILTLFSSFFGATALAAQSAISTVASLAFFVPFSVGISSSTRVANFVGANRIDGPAQIVAKIGLSAAVIVGLFNAMVLFFGRYIIADIYSNDPGVIALIVKVLPFVAAIQLFDALNTVAGSLLRGQGMPYIGGIINFVAYDFFAIPLAMLLGYHYDLELVGLWIGIGCGLFVIGLSETWYVLNVDWEEAVRKCRERNRIKV
ncbi:hypothetical protein DASC09_015210 [Saccharomycopsis crataegensis]|uniref:Uncharacterized protein n=1 Tax=Saccharomycopsis crataegensis TaxID=43959 RepID=A0AAV5QHN4_9ASCO|nr:hypothetical protein DASC09_015210 [Saccharomycopsis crataegensis]